MQLSQQDYNTLLKKAKNICFDYPHIDPSDIVNDVLLEVLEKGEPLMLHELVNKVQYHAKNSGANKINAGASKNGVLKNSKINRSEQTRCCTDCHEPLPISAFSIVRRNVGKSKNKDALNVIEEILYYCKPCQRKRVAERKKINKQLKNDTYKNELEYRRKYKREYQRKQSASQKAKRAEYMRNYYKNKPDQAEKQRARNRKKPAPLFDFNS